MWSILAVNANSISTGIITGTTGTTLSRDELKKWVDYARANDSVILFDSAYADPSIDWLVRLKLIEV